MSAVKEPFNIDILNLTKDNLRTLIPTTNLEIYVPGSKEFSEDGLFSAAIYGIPGDSMRDKKFSYIDTKTTVLHPYCIFILKKLKRLYIDVLMGREYAVFDDQTRDLVRSNELDGEKGYSFFMSVMKKIIHKETSSKKRKFYIDILQKATDNWETQYIMVLPAGLRDIDINETGKVTKDPINDHYRKILSNSRVLGDEVIDAVTLDQSRTGLQIGFNGVYDHINEFISGKHGFILKNFASRALQYGTRNVITSMNVSSEYLGDYNSVGSNHSMIGIYQLSKAIEPVTKHLIKSNYVDKLFLNGKNVKVVDRDTLQQKIVTTDNKTYDRWASVEGMSKIINELEFPEDRHRPVMIGSDYLGLIYEDGKQFKVFYDISDLPESFDKKYVRPLSKVEMIHIAGYMEWEKYPLWITRYPAIEMGSTYPSIPRVKTTLSQKSLIPLDMDWQPMDEAYRCFNFPDNTVPQFFETVSPNNSHIAALGADFDGDMTNNNCSMTDDAREEIFNSFNKASTYIDTDGGFRNPLSTDYSEMALSFLTYRD